VKENIKNCQSEKENI